MSPSVRRRKITKKKSQERDNRDKSAMEKPSGPTESVQPRKELLARKVVSFKKHDHNKWVVSSITDQKISIRNSFLRDLQIKVKRNEITQDTLNSFIAWGDCALHHKISKTTLESIGEMLEVTINPAHLTREQKKYEKNVQESAKKFWTMAQKTVSEEVKEKIAPKDMFVKLLWNMPLNLAIGPIQTLDNPGIGFDPDTVPDAGSKIPGARKLDKVSKYLETIEEIFLQNRDEGLKAEHWNSMATALENAYKDYAGGQNLVPPDIEQWVPGPNGNFQRKGLRCFLGQAEGLKKFQNDRDKSGLRISKDSIVAQDIFNITINDKTCALQVVVTGEGLQHFCTRHTYKYFDFDQIKAINTFWSQGTNLDSLRGKLEPAMKHVARISQEEIDKSVYSVEKNQWGSLEDLHAANQVVGSDTMFFIIGLEYDSEANQWKATIKTMAPDGNTGEAYSESELQEIKKHFPLGRSKNDESGDSSAAKSISIGETGRGSVQGEKQDSDKDRDDNQGHERLNQFILSMETISKDNITSENDEKSEDHNFANQYVKVAQNINSSKGFDRNLFKIKENKGGGDCLFHALEGKDLSMEELLTLRKEVAAKKLDMPPTHEANANNIVAALSQTFPEKQKWIQDLTFGRHKVSNEVYAKLQAVPGIYAGEDELQQWCILKEENVLVVDQDGTLTIFKENGDVERGKYEENSKLDTLKNAFGKVSVKLFKTSNHWERITQRLSQAPNFKNKREKNKETA